MKNKIGLINLQSYLQELNNLPSDRLVDSQKFNGRITLKDSFEYYSRTERTLEEMQLDFIDLYFKALNRTVGVYEC